MGHVICIASQKGGTGKTTTAVNLAASLALFEKRTLVVDCDPLGNATTGIGSNKDLISYSIFDALAGKIPFSGVTLSTCLSHLFLVPASNDLFLIESRGTPGIDCERVLPGLIRNTANEYDYIIIDSPPSLGYLCMSALASADYLIIPTQRRLFSFEGLSPLLSLIQMVRFRTNAKLKVTGILLTMVETDGCSSTEKTPDFLSSLKGRIFKTVIPMDATLADASDHGKPGVLYDITASGPAAYLNLAQEMHKMLSS
ncbi:MAG: ParA family protein [Desulfobacterales bacterium]|jgi:chromosome partitioning protein|nr:ParA family protein [Desulfobacterales bacterium]